MMIMTASASRVSEHKPVYERDNFLMDTKKCSQPLCVRFPFSLRKQGFQLLREVQQKGKRGNSAKVNTNVLTSGTSNTASTETRYLNRKNE